MLIIQAAGNEHYFWTIKAGDSMYNLNEIKASLIFEEEGGGER